MQAFEKQIADLETETENLSHSIEAQKHKTAEAEARGQKKAEELSRELQKKVRLSCGLLVHDLTLLQNLQVEQLRTKLTGFEDYDEIKRELDIMKVCSHFPIVFAYT